MESKNTASNVQIIDEVKDLRPPVVHFKGYGAGIDFENKATQDHKKVFLDLCKETFSNGGTLVWDGDKYKMESFTELIPDISNLCKNVDFLAFRKEDKVESFVESWNPVSDMQIQVYPLKNIQNYEGLGKVAADMTGTKSIMCFGGGPTVGKEYKMYGPDIQWDLIPVTRLHYRTEEVMQPGLLEFENESNVHIKGEVYGREKPETKPETVPPVIVKREAPKVVKPEEPKVKSNDGGRAPNGIDHRHRPIRVKRRRQRTEI